MANKYFKAILLIAFVMVSNMVAAQGPPEPPPPEFPINGGILGLLVLGLGYGIKKLYKNAKD